MTLQFFSELTWEGVYDDRSELETFQSVKVKGRILSVVYDADGSVYGDRGFEAGLTVLLDGKTVAHSDTLSPLTVELLF